MSDLLSKEALERAFSSVRDSRMRTVADGVRALRRHISALEKERDEWFKRAMVAETLRDLHREEREAALADNAALFQALCAAKEALGKAQVNIPWGTPPRLACGMAYDAIRVVVAAAHPGAALLEEHRKALDSAITKEREYRDQRIREEQAALTRALETIRAAMGELGEACREGGLIGLIGIMNGMGRIRARARNEGLEKGAQLVEGDDWFAQATRIRAMKESEE